MVKRNDCDVSNFKFVWLVVYYDIVKATWSVLE